MSFDSNGKVVAIPVLIWDLRSVTCYLKAELTSRRQINLYFCLINKKGRFTQDSLIR